MEIVYLSRHDVEGLDVTMKEVLEVVDEGLRLKGLGKTQMPPKPSVYPRHNCVMHPMPAYVGEMDVAGMKWICGYPPNPAKGLPYISGLLILSDPETGIPITVMDATWITAVRTGASAGIAAKYLARKDTSVAGLLGCGVQARFTLAALVETLPRLSRVRLYDLHAASAERFVAEMGPKFPDVALEICKAPGVIAAGAGVIVTAIPILREPDPEPLDAEMLEEGMLGVGLDYDVAWTQAAIRSCDRFVSDDIGQLLYGKEHSGHLRKIPDVIDAELGEIAAGVKPGRQNETERIFSMQMGIGIEDLVTAKLVLDRALQAGAGARLPL